MRIPPSSGNPHYQWLDRNKQYRWNKDPKCFVKALNSDKVKLSIIHCTQLLEAGLTESSGQMIQKIIREAAKIALHPKSTKQRINKNKHPKKWFDLGCIKFKNRARVTSRGTNSGKQKFPNLKIQCQAIRASGMCGRD